MVSILNSNRQFLFSLSKQIYTTYENNIIRCLATHWDPKFKKLRKNKFAKVRLIDFDEKEENVKRGVEPPTSFIYKPLNITSAREVFDPYVPPEGDGKASVFSKEFASRAVEKVSKSFSQRFKHSRLVKKYDESFEESVFGELAQQIYIDAHNSLMTRDPENLLNFVTENALSKMYYNMKFKTIRWKWIESLEPPSVKHVVTREMLDKTDLYGQITVRFHSKQILAVYDRFGRLAFGSDKLPKDVIEYVVFEKHLTSLYGKWRIHDKILPSWMPERSPIIRSYVQPEPFKVDENIEKKVESKFKGDDSHLEKIEAGS